MNFGLPERTIEQMKACFSQYPDIEWVKIYGSRAIGTFHAGSDIDLAFSGPIDHSIKLASALAEQPTPYLFDVTHYDSLQNENLKEHIDRVGKTLFLKADLSCYQQSDTQHQE